MKPAISVLIFFGLILAGQSAVYMERQPFILGHEGQCYDPTDKTFYEEGEEMPWTGNGCGKKVCVVSRGTRSAFAEIQTCGKAMAPPECQLKVDPSQPYPECCGWFVCPNSFDFDSGNELD